MVTISLTILLVSGESILSGCPAILSAAARLPAVSHVVAFQTLSRINLGHLATGYPTCRGGTKEEGRGA